MDNDSLLDVIDGTSDLFGQHDSQGGLYNWADEFLGDEMDLSSNTVTVESGNLVTNVNQPNLLLTSQNYAITSSVPAQNIAIASSQFHAGKSGGSGLVTQNKTAVINQAVQLNTNQTGMTQIVQQGNQQFILRTPSGGQIQLSQQQQLQFQQQILRQQQQQQQQQQNTSFHQILAPQNSASQAGVVMSQSLTPNSMGGLSFSGTAGAITHTVSQMRASPAPNINLVHLPPQQQQHTSQQQQFQLAPGTILQIPTGGGTSQNLVNTTLIQGQHAILGNAQQGTLVNAQNTVIQNPNVVNVNVAAQHVLCGSPAQQPRTSLGLSHSPFNIQGTLIQTAEGKSILIPSQNLAQPINLQGLSVATPIAQPQIQQQTQNTVSNMLHLAQQQQTGGNQGLQQIVLNHQGQQILVQRAPASVGQPQNIILRTASGQSGIVQLQQRAPQAAQVQTAQHTLQALGAGSGQQLHVINQQSTAQQGVPVINIGGQNVTLQQLSSQLGNIQGLQIQQSQQVLQQQPLHQQTQHDQLTFTQGQGQLQQVQTSAGVMTYSQGQLTFTPHSTVVSQPKMSVSQSPLNQSDNSMNSVENQTRLILQQIHNSLKKSQANALSSAAANVSTIQAMHGNAMNVKQEYTNTSCASSIGNVHASQTSVPQISVKSEPNLIECLIKQESNVVSSNTGAGHSAKSVHGLLTSNAPVTLATTTVSQAATQMSLFVLSNSQNVISSNVSTNTNSFSTPSMSMGKIQNTTVVPKIENSSVNSAQIGTQNVTGSGIGSQSVTGSPQGTATLQTIHLPPELQHKFQQVQQEIRKVQAMTNITAQHKQKLQQLQIFQKQILLKGRVLATTKTDAQQLQQTLTTGTFTQAGLTNSYTSPISSVQSPSSTIAQIKASLQASSEMSVQRVQSPASQFSPVQSSEGLKNLLKQEMHTQPDSTSTLGQDIQNGNSLQNLLGSPRISSTAVSSSHQHGQSSQSLSGYQPSSSVNHSLATPPPNATPHLPSVANSQGSAVTTAASTVPQVAVPTQIKIADKVLTLSLTPAQKEKVQSYLDRMTPEQQMQYLQTQQHVLQRIQKQQALNAQIRAQVEAQKKQAALAGQGQTTVSASGQAKIGDSAPVSSAVLGPELKTIPIPNPGVITQPSDTPPTALRGQKRSYMDIPKGTLINQQIRQDQNHAIKPNTKQPFRSRGDACRRLLRYHVFQQYGPSTEDFQRFDGYMEDLSDELLKKKDRMFEKFRQLLVQETLRVQPSSELVMLQRMQNQDLRKTLEEEKLQVKVNPELFVPMPMKYLGKREPELDKTDQDTVQVKTEHSESSDSAYEFKEPAVKVEVKSEIEDDDSEDDENLESRAAKMRKLVIKTDGMNFSSSFKRMSMEGSQSSVDNERDMQEESDTNDYETNQSSVEIHESKRLSSLDDDDEDTNEYSNKDKFDDEAERAAMLISSADNSQDSQGDSSLDVYSVDNSQSQTSVQSNAHFYSNTRNFELANEHMYNSDDDDSLKDVNKYVHYSRHSSVNDNKQGMPKKASMVTNSAFDNLLDTADGEDSDIDDKFDMYQPITESLTDSEENSYYSADNALERKTIVIDDDDDDDDDSSRHNWKKSDDHKTGSNSHGEPDPDVEAQMESAINSILSLSQGASTSRQNSIYSYSQSHSFLDSQSESLFGDSHDLQAELDFQTDQSKMSMGVTARANRKSDGDFSTDLDAAVNSILM